MHPVRLVIDADRRILPRADVAQRLVQRALAQPVVFSVREISTVPALRSARSGPTSLLHIPVISAGGPGIATTIAPSFSTHQPGAVPRGFGIDRPEGTTVACFTFCSGICPPRLSKNARRCASSSGATYGSSPIDSAIASRVMSSSVGPSPPVQSTISERPRAWVIRSTSRWRLSPIWCM